MTIRPKIGVIKQLEEVFFHRIFSSLSRALIHKHKISFESFSLKVDFGHYPASSEN